MFIITFLLSLTDTGTRLVKIAQDIVGYEVTESVDVNGNNKIEKRIHLAKLEATKYKIPSSSTMIVKFISLPLLNNHDKKDSNNNSMAITVSPIKSVSGESIFDGGDCRIGIKSRSFNKEEMKATFGISFVSCTDNHGIAYTFEPSHSIGYLSELSNPGISSIKINDDDDGYLTIYPEKNYLVQLYEPIKSIDKKGISFFGRF